jgi:hypothetical protein
VMLTSVENGVQPELNPKPAQVDCCSTFTFQ